MKCRHCGTPVSAEMIDLGLSPPANAFHESKDEVDTYYPLRVFVCTECWLVQTDIESFKLDYDQLFTKDYPYFSSTSDSWVRHAEVYVKEMFDRFKLNEQSLVVEIGSNDIRR